MPAAGDVITPKLAGWNAVEPLQLLFFLQLLQIVRLPPAATAPMLPRRIWPADQAALAGGLARALKAEFDAGPTRQLFRSTRSHALAYTASRPVLKHG